MRQIRKVVRRCGEMLGGAPDSTELWRRLRPTSSGVSASFARISGIF